MSHVTFRLPTAMLDAAMRIGAHLGMGRSEVMRDALRMWIKGRMNL